MVSARGASPVPAIASRRETFFAASLLALAALLAYGNSLHGPFVFDDEYSIVRNGTLDSLFRAWRPPSDGGITVSGRPVLNVSLALNRAVSGSDPWSYHALNLAIHVGATLLLFGIVRRTIVLAGRSSSPPLPSSPPVRGVKPSLLAFFTALLWTLHPLQTESVTYTVQRAESLMGLFLLLTLYAFIRGATESRRWLGLSAAACLAGMATKEVMVAAPLLVPLYDRTFLASSWPGAWARRRGFYLTLAATWLVLLALIASTGGRGGTFALGAARAWWRYDLTQFVAVTRYLALTAWPAPLVIDYGTFWIDHPFDVLPQMLLLTLLGAGTFAGLRAVARGHNQAGRVLGFAGGAFFLLLAPSSLPPGTIQMIVEHRMYLPLAVVLVAIVLGFEQALGRRALPLLLALAVALGVTTWRRNGDYATPIRLFEDTVAKRPRNARAMALLADYYRRAGRLEDARRWLERSLQIEPGVVPVMNNLGDVWQELGEPPKAAEIFQQALARAPDDAATLNNLGNALMLAGRPADGIATLRRAAGLDPKSVMSRLNLANALARNGQAGDAAVEFAALVKTHPENVDAHVGYASLLQETGRRSEAITELTVAVRLKPDDAELHDRLGAALGRAGQLREALAEFEAALSINPADENARQNAALARRRLGGN